MPLLELRRLCAGYSGSVVLRSSDLAVELGECVGVFGVNGVGKSTLLRSIMGLCSVYSGEMLMQGSSLVGQRTSARVHSGMGYVPEGRGLWPELTVAETLLMGGWCIGNRGRNKARMSEQLDLFPALATRVRQRAGSLSGGEQQMLAISRALMCEPKLLLIDEPSIGLSPVLLEEVMHTLRAIVESSGCSVLLVEQRTEYAAAVCHRGYVMKGGGTLIEAAGTELRSEQFVGSQYLGI